MLDGILEGCSIFAFDLSKDELHNALYGKPAELVPKMAVVGLPESL